MRGTIKAAASTLRARPDRLFCALGPRFQPSNNYHLSRGNTLRHISSEGAARGVEIPGVVRLPPFRRPRRSPPLSSLHSSPLFSSPPSFLFLPFLIIILVLQLTFQCANVLRDLLCAVEIFFVELELVVSCHTLILPSPLENSSHL